ncbi:MAG: NAD-dependent epimerase/dehydratase family protein [Burkholderiales bacterium]|nr:NAD-dependent epimerase/dehydratase family protein [Burkholderiales bacterium]MEB2336777.1 NAD-dependent epimerase/dehydratase family protein [Burkholderiales bacterium]
MSAPVIVTGAAGFIGMHLCRRLLADGRSVVGIDNLNDYYDPRLKRARLATLAGFDGFAFHEADVADRGTIDALFDTHRPQKVVHLAAQAGVRYALTNPMAYADTNLAGMAVMLEACRRLEVRHLVFASSSSVYGANRKLPFSERDPVDHPVSLYAATKRANELMAHSYAHLFALPVTGLRYFTVYGPWGRPDMAIWKFTDALLRGKPIDVYGGGVLSRDFTYIDDTVEATVRLLDLPREPSSSANPADWNAEGPDTSWAPFELVNLGRSDPVSVNELIARLEAITGRGALRNEMGMQPGDVERTFSSTEKLVRLTGFTPGVPLDEGLRAFVAWFREYHRIDR